MFVEWEEVDKYSRNGIILEYNITYTVEKGASKSKIVRPATTLQTVISGLSIWTFYNVSVAAYTNVGLGPFSPFVRVSTEEGGKYIQNAKLIWGRTCFIQILIYKSSLISNGKDKCTNHRYIKVFNIFILILMHAECSPKKLCVFETYTPLKLLGMNSFMSPRMSHYARSLCRL